MCWETMSGRLILEDGTEFHGRHFGFAGNATGEIVFQTGMVGYVESLTDPSYHRQLLTLTYPLVGNYGVPGGELTDFAESGGVWPAALIVDQLCESTQHSHWSAKESLDAFLARHKVPGLMGIDTRELTKKIREHGSMAARLVFDGIPDADDAGFVDINKENLVQQVSSKEPKWHRVEEGKEAALKVIAVDCGMKMNQIRCLNARGIDVKVVPFDYAFAAEAKDMDGVFLSNGPGDPSMCIETIGEIQKLLAAPTTIPLMGICLGNQLLALAAGAKTYKLQYGNRGQNQPCIHEDTQRCFITTQNHGYAVATPLPAGWLPLFTNANDGTNEGIVHETKPVFSVQFHPEHRAGPEDMELLFDVFTDLLKAPTASARDAINSRLIYPPAKDIKKKDIHKVLVLGSGGLTIGQAGEFDYSGSQALKALKEEGIKTVLINPNIATVQTTKGFADQTYFLPVTHEYVRQVIKAERPDGILLSFGGQTALNCGLELEAGGTLAEFGVEVLGTPVASIETTEDRQAFAEHVKALGETVASSQEATSLEEAEAAGEALGYPVLVRAAFALGGLGSGFAENAEEMRTVAGLALLHSSQLIIDKSFRGWKEVEYEVVRDAFDNCVTVCNMENVDPLGIHTGESIVVAPSQTLTNREYQMLRTCALKVIRSLRVVGECNIQYALNPDSEEFFIIEVNARLSRSSALASKATGYPLAYVAAKLALNIPLPALRNSVTGDRTTLCFEPSLDYVVVKMPRWDLSKFSRVSTRIGSSMKSVGEAMSIGRSFEEALQKAIRMVDEGAAGFDPVGAAVPLCDDAVATPTDKRIFILAAALHSGRYSIDRLHELTKIDRWFLHKMRNIIELRKAIEEGGEELGRERLLLAKQLGFSDAQLAALAGKTELGIRADRKRLGVAPVVKAVDTVSAEFPSATNYLYFTYNGASHDVLFPADPGYTADMPSVAVLGSGVYRIGSSVEFDSCAVACVQELRKLGYSTIMVNCNPETVSTDYDMCERLYFEEISFEVAMNVYELEAPEGLVLCMGGQLPNNIAMALHRSGVRVLGTSPECIDRAENRYKFSRMCDDAGLLQPRWQMLSDLDSARAFCAAVGYPCLIRPSYVLSGAAMNVAHSQEDLENFLQMAARVSNEHPVVVSKFILDAKEIDVDAVADEGRILLMAVSEHVENAGVHSGDATLVCPAQDLNDTTMERIRVIVQKIAVNLCVSGPFNLQLIAKDNELKVIECNLRVSRSFPFVSKTLDADFVAVATRVLMNQTVVPRNVVRGVDGRVGVKVAQFSFPRLEGADVMLGVEMASTGEVAGFGASRHEAFLKALVSSGFRLPKTGGSVFLSIGSLKAKKEMAASVAALSRMGYRLFGSLGTADFYQTELGLAIQPLEWPFEKEGSPSGKAAAGMRDISRFVLDRQLDLIINLPLRGAGSYRVSSLITHGYKTRRLAVENGIPLLTDIKCAKLFVEALSRVGVPKLNPRVDCIASGRRFRLPGLVDVHVHMREPGAEHKEDWASGTRAALAGGVTLVLAMPNTTPALTDAATFDKVTGLAATGASCDFALFAGATAENAKEIAKIADRTAGLKMYLNTTFGPLKIAQMEHWEQHLNSWPKDWPLVAHAEGQTTAAIIFYAQLARRPIHICHVSSKEEIETIVKAKQAGLPVTCEVAPHHLFLTRDDVPKGIREVRPPLGSSADVAALWKRLEYIDCFATDHAPHTLAEKSSSAPPPGFPGVQTMLPLLLDAVNEGRLTIDDLVARLHTNPTRIFKLPVQPNTFIEVNMDEEWELKDSDQLSKSGWTPYAGRKGKGAVHRVVLRGEEAVVNGKVLLKPGFGLDVRAADYPVAQIIRPTPRTPSPLQMAHQVNFNPVMAELKERGESVRRVDEELRLSCGDDELLYSPNPLRPKSPRVPRGLAGKSLFKIESVTKDQLHRVFKLASKYKADVESHRPLGHILQGRVMSLMFLEPSTRTFASFDAAMKRLGGSVVALDSANSSATKGESLSDSVRVMGSYSDLVVLRTGKAGDPEEAAAACPVPVINAGDGTGQHPTQALLDVFTIREEIGTANNITIALVGDLKNGRTVHSLARLMTLYGGTRFIYVAIPGLEMPPDVVDFVKAKGFSQKELSLAEAVGVADVLYMTRVQRERFASEAEYRVAAESLRLTPELLRRHTARTDRPIIMHPLPRNQELSPSLDSETTRAVYFRQAQYGMFVRMALLSTILDSDDAANVA